jgi:hypothetical protein
MNVKMFVIDGYWEGNYGDLRHSTERFPHFEETLARIRSEGHLIGLWAVMRCSSLKRWLTTAMCWKMASRLRSEKRYYRQTFQMDCTQAEVQQVLRRLARLCPSLSAGIHQI